MGSITIGTNIGSLRAQRQLGRASSALEDTYTRLASGSRINRASDDAAGLAISESLRASSRVINRGVTNLNDGISVLNIADGALDALTSVITRLKELATESANGVYSNTQRAALDTEAQALIKEHDRIVRSTKFNDLDLFSSSNLTLSLQAGTSSIAVSFGTEQTVSSGDFQFSQLSVPMASNAILTPQAGDINGDGVLDIVAVNGLGSGTSDGYAEILFGNGDGTFGPIRTFWIGGGAGFHGDIELADTNNDGRLDIITGNGDGYFISLGNGDGTFKKASYIERQGPTGYGMAVFDYNQDGKIDILSNSTGTLKFFLGNGDGTFNAPFTKSGTAGSTMLFGDFNNDGREDILTGVGVVNLSLRQANGSYVSQQVSSGVGNPGIALGDINGDGILDFVGHNQGDGVFFTFLGNGNGTFGAPITREGGGSQSTPLLLDLNGDGRLDLAYALGNSVDIAFGNGDGTFTADTTYNVGFNGARTDASSPPAYGDYNGDGLNDIFIVGNSSFSVLMAIGEQRTVALDQRLLSTENISLTNVAKSRLAMPVLDQHLSSLLATRSTIGASMSRVSTAMNVLSTTSLNYQAAESRIRDVDVAEESSRLAALQILQSSAAAVLAHANQQPALAITLLTEK